MEFLKGSSPMEELKLWVDEYGQQLMEPLAFSLSTLSAEGFLNSRIVLAKTIDEDGLVFFTNYESQKAHDLIANPQAAALFYWDHAHRQIRLRGSVEKATEEESNNYWNRRPRGSQIASAVSQQSRPVSGRQTMERAFSQLDQRAPEEGVPRPDHWGGFRLRPHSFEFWIGQPNRFHDRHLLTRTDKGWDYQRLYP